MKVNYKICRIMKMKIYKNCTFLFLVQLTETLNLKSTKYFENLIVFLTKVAFIF